MIKKICVAVAVCGFILALGTAGTSDFEMETGQILMTDAEFYKYSEQQKADILASADTNMYHTDFSEYTIWLDTFASAEAFHNGNDSGMTAAHSFPKSSLPITT